MNFNCACLFTRDDEFSKATLVEPCAYHAKMERQTEKIEGLAAALERIHGMAERPACVCGRPTGTAAIKQCAGKALTAYKEEKS